MAVSLDFSITLNFEPLFVTENAVLHDVTQTGTYLPYIRERHMLDREGND